MSGRVKTVRAAQSFGNVGFSCYSVRGSLKKNRVRLYKELVVACWWLLVACCFLSLLVSRVLSCLAPLPFGVSRTSRSRALLCNLLEVSFRSRSISNWKIFRLCLNMRTTNERWVWALIHRNQDITSRYRWIRWYISGWFIKAPSCSSTFTVVVFQSCPRQEVIKDLKWLQTQNCMSS